MKSCYNMELINLAHIYDSDMGAGLHNTCSNFKFIFEIMTSHNLCYVFSFETGLA